LLEIAVNRSYLCCDHDHPYYVFSYHALGVGKTSFLLSYANESFSPTFITTIGIDFKIKDIQLDGMRIRLQVSCLRMPQSRPNIHSLCI
ncbi:hypothetical protein EON65_24100, partial [archaeon]